MNTEKELLERLKSLSSRERAAALAHWIYMEASHRKGWTTRVSDDWERLDEKAREFNFASTDMWAMSPDVLDAWIAAMIAYRNEIGDRS
ncbi:MAG: hypothetical protein JNJ49_11330 [Bdellovibrionaceae bacterium]|nr:hypothetical protein [Pseudobdellovibrionaceae bacterium]